MKLLKRLGIGLLKGLVVGGAVGAALQLGLGWTQTTGLLGYLLAMATGATAGTLAGTPPWKGEAWIEAVLKGVFGVGVGALLYWLGSSFAPFGLPLAIGGAPDGADWTSLPLLYAPAIGGVYGAIVELDNTGKPPKTAGERPKPKKSPAG